MADLENGTFDSDVAKIGPWALLVHIIDAADAFAVRMAAELHLCSRVLWEMFLIHLGFVVRRARPLPADDEDDD